MEALPDDQLVAHARKGDGDAFTELARRHQEKVFQTVLWMIKNQQDADVQGQKNASEQIASLFGRKRMKCQQIEQWLSDSVDGPISKKERAIIQAHIETCPACRAFRDRIEQINEEARNLDAPEVSPAESREFSSRLRSALIEIEEEKNKGVLHVFRNKWIFVPASVIMLSLFILIFVFYEKGDFQDEEFYVFSFGNAVEEIYQDMGSDLVLQEAFDSLVSASINEMLITADWDETLNLAFLAETREFMHSEERKVFLGLRTDKERDYFIHKFWEARRGWNNISTLYLLRMVQVLDLTEEQTVKIFPKVNRVEKEKREMNRKIGQLLRELRARVKQQDVNEEELSSVMDELKKGS